MAKILFTWELGMGLGHLSGIKSLCDSLNGHELHLAAKDLRNIYPMFSDIDIEVHQAPYMQGNLNKAIDPSYCFSHILHNIGFGDANVLRSLVQAWRNLFDAIEPDVVIFEHSPTALLAATPFSFKKIEIGTGFTCPSLDKPLGLFFPDVTTADAVDSLIEFERDLLVTVNNVLANVNCPALGTLQEIYTQVDETIIAGIPDLDHFPQRKTLAQQHLHYTGVPLPEKSKAPEWPTLPGKRIFAYTHRFHKLPLLLSALTQSQQPSIVFSSSIHHELIKQFTAANVQYSDIPLDVNEIAKTCDFAITNGNYNLSSQLLMRGVPLVLIPLHREQQIFARLVEKTGACLVVDHRSNDDIIEKLNTIANTNTYKQRAEELAQKLKQFLPAEPNAVMKQVLVGLDQGDSSLCNFSVR